MMSKIKLKYEIKLSTVGKSYYDCKPFQIQFSICDIILLAGLTKKDEFTLGQDGITKVNLSNFKTKIFF